MTSDPMRTVEFSRAIEAELGSYYVFASQDDAHWQRITGIIRAGGPVADRINEILDGIRAALEEDLGIRT